MAVELVKGRKGKQTLSCSATLRAKCYNGWLPNQEWVNFLDSNGVVSVTSFLEPVIDLNRRVAVVCRDERDQEVVSERRDGCGMGVFAAVFDVDA